MEAVHVLDFSMMPALMRDFLNRGLAISPWLAGVDSTGRLNVDEFARIDSVSRELSNTMWTHEQQVLYYGGLTIPQRIGRTAVYEILASTAVSLAHDQLGQNGVNALMTEQAIEKVVQFIQDHSFGLLVRLYTLATGYENMQAVKFYGSMLEHDFINSSMHRPWVDYSLEDEVLVGIENNFYVRKINTLGQAYLELTPAGLETFKIMENILEETGYLARRIRQLHISRFNVFFDYDRLVEEISPDTHPYRREFLDFVSIQPGMRVLELGCGDGNLTFEAGLAERVGPEGQIIGIDPSIGMLKRAETIRERRHLSFVRFEQGRAEQIPYPDDTFDIVLGTAFLHFTVLEDAIKEMHRVVRPGGIVASGHPNRFDPAEIPFFRDWFSPILSSAASRKEKPRNFLPDAATVIDAFHNTNFRTVEVRDRPFTTYFTDPVKAIHHFIHGVGWFQEELATLPWKARQDLIEELQLRGQRVTKQYPPEDLILRFPSQFIKAIK